MSEFYICAPSLDFEKINALLKIPNCKIRKKESFAIKEFAKDYWSIDTGYVKSDDINIQIENIYSLIKSKSIEINMLKELFDAETGFVITVKRVSEEMLPAIYFENEFIRFVASIGANINMDFS